MLISRLKQLFSYFFEKYDILNNNEVKSVLSTEEYIFFDKMDNYDKLHSFKLYKKTLVNPLLKNDTNYLKLALLHDSAKGHNSFYERMIEVTFKKSKLSNHGHRAFENLKNINFEVAKLCKIHHTDSNDIKMKEFQKLDD
ncbi:MAG: phosphohydrolase [Fusobacteriaceae bacterium]|jgi:hypothetical protein|nr:phosphohydrolase [Fusobacteriaceae bacterium]